LLVVAAVSLGPLLAAQRRADADVRAGFDGIWNSATATPLERPQQFKDKAFFTPQEAAAWEREVADRNQEPSPEAAAPEADAAPQADAPEQAESPPQPEPDAAPAAAVPPPTPPAAPVTAPAATSAAPAGAAAGS